MYYPSCGHGTMWYQSLLSWRIAVSVFLAMPLFITRPLFLVTMSRLTYVLGLWHCALSIFCFMVTCNYIPGCDTVRFPSSAMWQYLVPIFWRVILILWGVAPCCILLLERGQSPYLVWKQRALPTFHCLSAALHGVTSQKTVMLIQVVIVPWASKRTKVESHRQLLQTVRMSWRADADLSY